MAEKKSQKISVYLIQKSITRFSDALKNRMGVEEYKIKPSLKLDGVIYVGKTIDSPVKWVELLQQGTQREISELSNSSNRALVLVKVDGRMFALPFGFGKYLLKEDVIEREFGLRTTLNIVDPDKLRSLNKANVNDLTLLTTTQTSRRAKPQEFNIDIVRDLLRGITGEPFSDYKELGKVVTGNEGVYFVPSINFEDIESMVSSVGRAFRSKRYKEQFDWIDNIRQERNPVVLETLQASLLSDLKSKNNTPIHLAAPAAVEWESYEGFSFTENGELFVDLGIEAYYRERAELLEGLTWEKLKSQRIFIKYEDSDERIAYPLVRSLNYSKKLGNEFYVFGFGQWYRVNASYSKETLAYVKSVPESKLNFIDCKSSWDEKKYNKELCKSDSSYVLFDRKLIKSDAYRSGIEVCDIFANKKEFVHVKFKSSSATLSHLFAQGRISCTLLAKDVILRRNLRSQLKKLGLPANIVPEKELDLDTSKYIVTFAIIADGHKSFVECLPFFSLLNFRLTVSELRSLGFSVKVKKINYS
jgi:uncharacterized protein (TIGR04141 family)